MANIQRDDFQSGLSGSPYSAIRKRRPAAGGTASCQQRHVADSAPNSGTGQHDAHQQPPLLPCAELLSGGDAAGRKSVATAKSWALSRPRASPPCASQAVLAAAADVGQRRCPRGSIQRRTPSYVGVGCLESTVAVQQCGAGTAASVRRTTKCRIDVPSSDVAKYCVSHVFRVEESWRRFDLCPSQPSSSTCTSAATAYRIRYGVEEELVAGCRRNDDSVGGGGHRVAHVAQLPGVAISTRLATSARVTINSRSRVRRIGTARCARRVPNTTCNSAEPAKVSFGGQQ